MQVSLAVLADGANTSTEGKLNILGTFDRINAEGYPAVHLRCTLVIRFRPDPSDEGQVRNIEILFQDIDAAEAEPLIRLQSAITVADATKTFDNILQLQGLPLPRAGEYQFSIRVEGAELARVPVTAGLIEPGTR